MRQSIFRRKAARSMLVDSALLWSCRYLKASSKSSSCSVRTLGDAGEVVSVSEPAMTFSFAVLVFSSPTASEALVIVQGVQNRAPYSSTEELAISNDEEELETNDKENNKIVC